MKNLKSLVLSQINKMIMEDNFKQFKILTKGYPEFLNCELEEGKTALYMCIEQRKFLWVQHLLEQGSNCEVVSNDNKLPMYAAIMSNHLKTVKLLVSYGADPFLCTNADRGSESIELAVMIDNIEIVSFLIEEKVKVKNYTETINLIQSREMVELLENNQQIFSEDGKEYWEEQKIAFLLKPTQKNISYSSKKVAGLLNKLLHNVEDNKGENKNG